MLSEFIEKKIRSARYKILQDGSYFGEIPGLKGVWADANNLEDCRKELKSALEDWILVKLKDGDAIPGLKVGVGRRHLIKTSEYAR